MTEETENKKEAALSALQKIRERVKPLRDSADAPKEETTLRPRSVQTEEKYNGVRILDDPEQGVLKIFFPYFPAEKVRRYLKKHGFAWEAGEQCWQCERAETAGYHARKAVDRGVVG
jgi:hypothetical protein